MWEKWGVRFSNASLQVWMGGSEELGIRVAGLRVGQHSKENSGDLRRVTWISWMCEGERRPMDLWENKSLKSCGEQMTVGAPQGSFYFPEWGVQLLPEHVGRLAILEVWDLIALVDKWRGWRRCLQQSSGLCGRGQWGMIWENGIETCKLSHVKRISSPGSMHDTGMLI